MLYRSLLYISLVVLVSACGGGASSGASYESPNTASTTTTTATSTSNSSSSSSSSSSASNSSSSSTTGENNAAVPSVVVLQWQRPEQRENGEYLEADEIGGYELRYKKINTDEFSHLVVEDGWLESFEFQEKLVGAYQFQIAAFDTNGLYSEFVDLQVN